NRVELPGVIVAASSFIKLSLIPTSVSAPDAAPGGSTVEYLYCGSAGGPVNCCPLLELAATVIRAANAGKSIRNYVFSWLNFPLLFCQPRNWESWDRFM